MSASRLSSTDENEDPGEGTTDHGDQSSELAAQVDVLATENQRLREEYARAQRAQHRRTALALVGVGLLAALGGVAFPDSRTVLFALSGTGVFTGVLTYFITPERFVPANVGDSVYTALANNDTGIVNELGLQDVRIYLPTGEGTTGSPARLYVPQNAEYDVPERAALDSVFVVTDDEASRGIAFSPSGGALFHEFERAVSGDVANAPEALAAQLGDALTDQFELVDDATVETAASDEQLSVGISGSTYGDVDRFDHPVASFLGVGFAVGLDGPVTVETTTADDRADTLVTIAWTNTSSVTTDSTQETTTAGQ